MMIGCVITFGNRKCSVFDGQNSFIISSEPMFSGNNVVAALFLSKLKVTQKSEQPILYFLSNICALTQFCKSAICDVTKGTDSSHTTHLTRYVFHILWHHQVEETTEYWFKQEGRYVSLMTGGCKQGATSAVS